MKKKNRKQFAFLIMFVLVLSVFGAGDVECTRLERSLHASEAVLRADKNVTIDRIGILKSDSSLWTNPERKNIRTGKVERKGEVWILMALLAVSLAGLWFECRGQQRMMLLTYRCGRAVSVRYIHKKDGKKRRRLQPKAYLQHNDGFEITEA